MSLLTLVTLLIVVTAPFGIGGKGGESSKGPSETSKGQTGIPKTPFDSLLAFKADDYEEAFKSLDVNNDDEIKIDDLKTFYYHPDSHFAIQKFIELLDTTKTPGSIDLEELTNFMKKDHVKRKAHRISFIPTAEGRKAFYADDILTYVYLVLEQNAIDKLFDAIESSQDGKLDFNEIKRMQMKLMNGDTKYELSDGEVKLVLAEIGAGSETISKEDFKYYLQDGDLSFLFRECRKKLTPTGAEYDNACLIRKLVRYTSRHLTEYMMTLVFDELDAQDKNQKISFTDVQEVYGCNEHNARHFIRYINGQNKKEITYAELRPLLGLPTIKYFLEEGCLGEGKDFIEFEGRAFCLSWKLWNLISKNFFPKFVGVPDLDLIILFEDLDTSNDGIIEQREDLEKGKRWGSGFAAKFMDELENPNNKGKVNLHDFFYYVYEPYILCAVGECQIMKDKNEKLACYNNEMKDMINNILDKKEVTNFFGFYKSDVIYNVPLERLDMLQPVVENFLNELGQGDHYVNPTEFKYFVKQQEIVRLFITTERVSPRKHFPPNELHVKLIYYLDNYMTEYDIVILFGRLDVNSDRVLDMKDVEKVSQIDADFVARIAIYGNRDHATFQEFWLFLNTNAPGTQEPRKRQLEKECGQINQEKQLNCFKGKLKELQ